MFLPHKNAGVNSSYNCASLLVELLRIQLRVGFPHPVEIANHNSPRRRSRKGMPNGVSPEGLGVQRTYKERERSNLKQVQQIHGSDYTFYLRSCLLHRIIASALN